MKQLQHDYMSASHLNRLILCKKKKKRDEMVSECIHGALKSLLDFYRYIITLLFFELVHAEWRTVKGSNKSFFFFFL